MKITLTTPSGHCEFISNNKVYLDIEVGDKKIEKVIDVDGLICDDE